MKKIEKQVVVKEFLKELDINEILRAVAGKYTMHAEVLMAFLEVYNLLTKSDSEAIPNYKLTLMFVVSRNACYEDISSAMTHYYGLTSLVADRTYKLNKTKVKNVADYANAIIEIAKPTGEFGISYEEQAAILLLSFCIFNNAVIENYALGKKTLSAMDFLIMVKNDDTMVIN